jgi:hypothetical protein
MLVKRTGKNEGMQMRRITSCATLPIQSAKSSENNGTGKIQKRDQGATNSNMK